MKIYDFLSNLFFPRKCMFCNKVLPFGITVDYCVDCESNAAFERDRLCKICGKPITVPRGDLICNLCRKKKYSFIQNVTRYLYDGNARNAIIRMKFRGNNQWIALSLGKLLAETVVEEYADITFDCVTYVPISKKRMRDRGFNQSELIAGQISQRLGVPLFHNTLVKIKDNPKQSRLKAALREKNVKGVYQYGTDSVADMTVLLVDDVYTTGATLNECARMLKKSGALLVYCATVCTTERGNRFCISEKNLKKLKNG